MVAKSHPRRRTAPEEVAALPPDQWPAWIMSFGKGYFPDDPVRQAVRTAEFHQWRRDRDAWLAKAGVTWMAVHNEHRRRGEAWLALHPEDRGPTFGRAKD
jgi:hypothetical protein